MFKTFTVASLLIWSSASGFGGVDFNREIRPILSQNCLLCHGPDEHERKGGLRLDLREEALKPAKSGKAAIVPGKPEESELIARVGHTDADELMPPSKSGKSLSKEQIALLKQWVSEGAGYAVHWSYNPPVRPALPKVKEAGWPKQAMDHFIAARLEAEGLKPQGEAGRYELARRVALDLTGLPPTIEEADAFAADEAEGAFERYVDKLLAKESFGEHWARLWLDLARYADSAGYADDPLRTIWRYRDYVIKAFNENKPFDRFTLEQIAGDMLPEAGEEEMVATAFHRNTMTNNEGGTNDEEFRSAAIVDRVNTTMAVWMGTSMACAQCHTHKYDPITHEEYFQFYAFFNNTEDADRPDETPTLPFFTGVQKVEREKLQARMGEVEKILTTVTPELQSSFDGWLGRYPQNIEWKQARLENLSVTAEAPAKLQEFTTVQVSPARETLTVEIPAAGESLSALRIEPAAKSVLAIAKVSATVLPPEAKKVQARYVRVEIPGKEKILSLAEVQVFAGSENVAMGGTASQSSSEFGAGAERAIDGKTSGVFNEKSVTHTSSSENPWWQVDLKSAREISRIVLWNRTDANLHTRLKDFRLVALDEKQQVVWEKFVETAPNPSSEFSVDGQRAVQFAGAYSESNSERAGAVVAAKPDLSNPWRSEKGEALTVLAAESVPLPEGSRIRLVIESQAGAKSFTVSVSAESKLMEFARVTPVMLGRLAKSGELNEETRGKVRDYYLREIAPELTGERKEFAELKGKFDGIRPITVPVMRELAADKRRKTQIHLRGNFADLGKEVAEGVPVAFGGMPEGTPRTRLGLAEWLVSGKNPLTARVVVNRFWEQIFGVGLVRTSEEFGSQGELPSHPELLDWLAVELVEGGWDVKRFLKMLVTSAAYRQSSKVSPELAGRDPENRLLASGPRVRLSAEMVRDNALFVAGLLSPTMYGPSVKPPRPASGLSAAFGSSVDWQTSQGADRFRRGLYTEWRRTSPYPSMATFDAPNREVCTVRRNRTNTPLQALVTLNDPVYFEAAQALGRRMAMRQGTMADKIAHGFRLTLIRNPDDAELKRLAELFGEALSECARLEAKELEKLATDPIGAVPAGTQPLELAAWATVGNVLLNLDETLMKR